MLVNVILCTLSSPAAKAVTRKVLEKRWVLYKYAIQGCFCFVLPCISKGNEE